MTDMTLTIYTTDNCHRCRIAMTQLDREGIAYNVVNVSHDEEGAERLKRAGIASAPVFGYRGSLRESLSALPEIVRDHKERAKSEGSAEDV